MHHLVLKECLLMNFVSDHSLFSLYVFFEARTQSINIYGTAKIIQQRFIMSSFIRFS